MSQARNRQKFAVRREAGFAIQYTSPQIKHTADVMGISHSGVSRRVTGEISGVVGDFYELVRSVVRDQRTNAGHLITGAMLVAEEAAVALGETEVRARLLEAIAQESALEGSENQAQHALALALGEDGPGLRAALEGYDAAVRHEQAAHLDAVVYARALAKVRGWR